MAAVASSMIAMGFLSAEMMRWIWPDDDDDEKSEYDYINEFLKDNYMILPNPAWMLGRAKDKYISIPLPHGFRMFHAMGVITSDALHGKLSAAEMAARLSDNAINVFSPININVGVLNEKGELNARPFVPSWYMPIYDISNNEDFAGRRVFRQMFTQELEKTTPEWQKGLRNTNKLLVEGSRALNKLAGGTDDLPANFQIDANGNFRNDNIRQLLNVNPAKLEHIITGYTGGLGQFFNDMFKTTVSIVEVAAQSPDASVDANDVPVLKRLYRSNFKQGLIDQYYELRRETSGAKTMLKKISKEDNRFMLMRKNMELQRKIKTVELLDPKIKDINEKIQEFAGNKQKQDELIEKRESMLRKAFDIMNKNDDE